MTRRGGVSLLLLASVPVAAAVAVLVIGLAAGRLVRTDLQTAADAAALAAARELVAGGSPHEAADRVATANGVEAELAVSDDTVTAVTRRPTSGLIGRDLAAASVAAFDRRLVGFRPLTDAPLPLVPLALLAPTGRPPSRVRLADQAAVLRLGVGSFRETVRQCRDGVPRPELEADCAGGHVLDADNHLKLQGAAGGPPAGSPTARLLRDALRSLRGPRFWPLCDQADGHSVRVIGWMAASVERVEESDSGLSLTLVSARLAHPAAVCEGRQTPPGFWAFNTTAGRVRLVERR